MSQSARTPANRAAREAAKRALRYYGYGTSGLRRASSKLPVTH